MQKCFQVTCLLLLASFMGFAQIVTPVYFKGAIKEKKIALHKNIVQNTIQKNLSLPLSADTEEYWADAFWAMEVLRYKSPWTDGRVSMAFDSAAKRSAYFQRVLLELAYANFDARYAPRVSALMQQVTDMKAYAMCVEFLLAKSRANVPPIKSIEKKKQLVRNEKDEAIAKQLFGRLTQADQDKDCDATRELAGSEFLRNNTILFSFQRKNRDYPGLAVIRDSTGKFVTAENGTLFSVSQLARSISNLPGYLTNGNTPQGIFRMFGLDTSKSNFIGPSPNIQLTMPFETSLQHFFNDTTITDTAWTEKWYKKLLPGSLKNCPALFESFYAGKAGRTEIIAHGTTIDPEYYRNDPYYPQTPTMGCLCTRESWSDIDGKRLYSDQAKLVEALLKAGGANGYCVVVEIDDMQKPVAIEDVLEWIKH